MPRTGETLVICWQCKGMGVVNDMDWLGRLVIGKPCPRCNGDTDGIPSLTKDPTDWEPER